MKKLKKISIGPAFFSHIRHMRILGISVLLSYIISIIFYEDYLVSVWCFFASIISISVYIIMQEIDSRHRKEIRNKISTQKPLKKLTKIQFPNTL